ETPSISSRCMRTSKVRGTYQKIATNVLPPAPFGGPLLEESLHALLCIEGGGVQRHHVLGVIVCERLRHLQLAVEGALADRHHERARRRDASGQRAHRGVQLGSRNHARNEPG